MVRIVRASLLQMYLEYILSRAQINESYVNKVSIKAIEILWKFTTKDFYKYLHM